MLYCYPMLELELPHFIVPYGEAYKNLNSCEYIWKKLTELHATRDTILLCLGGGVICDMGSFAGSCFQRGMRVILCPTSLLAMVDASTGGKTGVNFLGFKNYIGSFSKAEEVYICSEFLSTLQPKEMTNGFVEMLKHGLIADHDHYDKVKYYFLRSSLELDNQLIEDSINIKQKHVDSDFRDNGIRKRLNFGHTIGHAIESWSLATSETNEELSHGTSVALGIIAESYISHKTSGLSMEELNEISTVLYPIVKQLESELPEYVSLLGYLSKDKKNKGGEVNFSLLSAIGACRQDYYVSDTVIAASIDYLKNIK